MLCSWLQVGVMTPLNVQEVIELLRAQVNRVGGQSEWARQTGIQRPLISRVLNGRRLPPSHLCRALGLEWVVVRNVAETEDQTKLTFISNREVLLILKKEIKKVGSIIAWSRQMGVERSHLSSVLHKRRSPDKKILAALKLSEVLVCAAKSEATRNRIPSKRQQHARWKKEPRIGVRGSNRHEG
jgi:DNA-binding phage protein